MKITLTTDQRINLGTIIGGSRWEAGMLRLAWAIQDLIALTPHEEAAIQLKREIVNNQEMVTWDPQSSIKLDDVEYDLTARQIGIIKTALRNFMHVAATRKWLEPLLDKFLPEDES